jgi:superfamily II DNA/RNA helicase
MAGSDLVGRARTGSGKTLAFSLPIIESILRENAETGAGRGPRDPRALILAPTRELAKQVAIELQSATGKGQIEVCTVYGGTPIGAQIRQIQKGIDVLVGTPGRVLDLVKKQRCALLSLLLVLVCLLIHRLFRMIGVLFGYGSVMTVLSALPVRAGAT